MRLGEVTFFPICLLPPSWLRELPSCLSAFTGEEEGSLSSYSLSSSFPPTAQLLAKEQSPRQPPTSPPPQLLAQEVSVPRAQGPSLGSTQPPPQLLAAFRANVDNVAWRSEHGEMEMELGDRVFCAHTSPPCHTLKKRWGGNGEEGGAYMLCLWKPWLVP